MDLSPSTLRHHRLAVPGQPDLALHRQPPPAAVRGVVLLIHGATFPTALAGAYPVEGRSWMAALARAGFDTWALDFAGFGASGRWPDGGRPGRALDAARQVAEAVAFVLRETKRPGLALVAHSWGTLPAGCFAAGRPEGLERLVLFGPVCPGKGGPGSAPEASHLEVTLAQQWAAFRAGVPPGAAAPFPEEAFRSWGEAYLGTDPDSLARTPPAVRVPAGPFADLAEAEAGRIPYDPGELRIPTLVVRGEWDAVTTPADAAWLLERLRSAPSPRLATLPRGTHRMHLEAGRHLLFRTIEGFLAEAAGTGSRP